MESDRDRYGGHNEGEHYPLLNTLYQMQTKIHYQGYENLNLYDKWADLRTEEPEDSDIPEIERDITFFIRRWCIEAPEKEIVRDISNLHGAARNTLRRLAPERFKGFFEDVIRGLPNQVTAPTPFLVIGTDQGSWFGIKKPIVLRYGKTSIKVQGTALKAQDGQLTFALLRMVKRKKIIRQEKTISFQTTVTEIAKVLLKKNPYDHNVHETIWSGLERLRGCVLTLTDEKGLRTLGGILSSAQELKDHDHDGVGKGLTIYLDRDFLNLFEDGFTGLDPDIYFNLSPKEANLYLYLQRQQVFNQGKVLHGKGIEHIYKTAGLGGLNLKKKTALDMHRELDKTLCGLQQKKVFGAYSLINGKCFIFTDAKAKRFYENRKK
jgi:hypothetical protein